MKKLLVLLLLSTSFSTFADASGIPENAYLNSSGSAWFCNDGYQRQANACLKEPIGAFWSRGGWFCVGYGGDVYELVDYELIGKLVSGGRCKKCQYPNLCKETEAKRLANDRKASAAAETKRIADANKAEAEEEEERKVDVSGIPENAYLNYSGSSWFCNDGYLRQENVCLRTETILHQIRTNSNYIPLIKKKKEEEVLAEEKKQANVKRNDDLLRKREEDAKAKGYSSYAEMKAKERGIIAKELKEKRKAEEEKKKAREKDAKEKGYSSYAEMWEEEKAKKAGFSSYAEMQAEEKRKAAAAARKATTAAVTSANTDNLLKTYVHYMIIKNLYNGGNYYVSGSQMKQVKAITIATENYYKNSITSSTDNVWQRAINKYEREWAEYISTLNSYSYNAKGAGFVDLIMLSIVNRASKIGVSNSNTVKDF